MIWLYIKWLALELRSRAISMVSHALLYVVSLLLAARLLRIMLLAIQIFCMSAFARCQFEWKAVEGYKQLISP